MTKKTKLGQAIIKGLEEAVESEKPVPPGHITKGSVLHDIGLTKDEIIELLEKEVSRLTQDNQVLAQANEVALKEVERLRNEKIEVTKENFGSLLVESAGQAVEDTLWKAKAEKLVECLRSVWDLLGEPWNETAIAMAKRLTDDALEEYRKCSTE